MDKVKDLMEVRYKVIADYPKSLYNVGDILKSGWRSEDCIYCDTEGPRWRHYPHLFKKLEWWEEREIEEMPEYVKHIVDGTVIRVNKIVIEKNHKSIFSPDLKFGSTKYIDNYQPASLEYYTHYLNQKQNK